ncbi:MAG TPA: GAF domain-containing protein [Armatimonadota bacterium]
MTAFRVSGGRAEIVGGVVIPFHRAAVLRDGDRTMNTRDNHSKAAAGEIQDLVRTTIDACVNAMKTGFGLTGFLAALDAPGGAFAAFGEGLCPADDDFAVRLFDAFRDAAEPWHGAAGDLAARCGLNQLGPSRSPAIVYPLRAAGRLCGVLVILSTESAKPEILESWRGMLEGMRCVAALSRQYHAERSEADALRALDAISHALTHPADLDALYRAIHTEVSRVMPCDVFTVCLCKPRGVLHFVYQWDQGVDYPAEKLRLEDGPTVTCLRTREPFVLDERNRHIHVSGSFLGPPVPSASAIHVPMLVEDEVVGVISSQSYRPHGYDERHVRLLSIIASKAGVAVRNTQLVERVRSQVAKLEKLTRALKVREQSLERVDDLVVTTDENGIVTAYNEAVTRTLGYSPREMIGRSVLSVRASGPGYWDIFRGARNRRITILTKDGRPVPVIYSTEPLRVDGRVTGWLTVARDLTAIQRTEEEHRRSMAMERGRISRDLHDGLIQSLSIARMQIQILQREHPTAEVGGALLDLQATLTRGLVEARHYVVDLKHAQLGPEGLIRAARAFAQELGRVTGLAIGVLAAVDSSPLSDTEEVQLFYILREALNNVRKHAAAKRVWVEFRQDGGEFRMSIEDDGQGFDLAGAPLAGNEAHWGLSNIRERADALGGRARVESAPGKGTVVSVFVPLPPGEETI